MLGGGQTIRFDIIAAIALILPFGAEADDHVRIYVYAQRLTAARSWLPISGGGAVLAELKQGTFFAIDVTPGRYTLSSKGGVPLAVDARPGEDFFIRLDWSYAIGRPAISELHAVHQDQARKEMKYLSYINVRKVFSSSVAKTDPRDLPDERLKRRDEP